MTTADEERPGLDHEALEHLLGVQHGVVARRQMVELGAQEWDTRRMLRRHTLYPVHPGVFVNHNGSLTSAQRRWAAVLAHWPAALTLESALPGHEHDQVIHVAIALGRTIRPTVARLRAEIERRPRLKNRPQLLALLDDLAVGATSVLERQWLEVEVEHGLPTGERQHPTSSRGKSSYLDVRYKSQGVRVELDGREFHDAHSGSWESDHERDLDAIAEGDELTVRLMYGQVFRRGCATAARVAAVLRRRGWEGDLVPCATCAPKSDVR